MFSFKFSYILTKMEIRNGIRDWPDLVKIYFPDSSFIIKKEDVKNISALFTPSSFYDSIPYTAGFQMRWLYLPSTAARIHPKISQEITSPIPTVSIMSGIGSRTPYA